MAAATGGAGVPRTRSLGGCSTCREKHMKCDEARPTCAVCRRLGLECAGYETRITFSFEGCEGHGGDSGKVVGDGQGPRFRRPLFTERQRRDMSNSLVSSVRPSTTNAMLSLLDFEGAELEGRGPDEADIVRGPFSVFKVRPCQPIVVAGATPPASSTSSTEDTLGDSPSPPLLGPVEIPMEKSLQELIDEVFPDFQDVLGSSLGSNPVLFGDVPIEVLDPLGQPPAVQDAQAVIHSASAYNLPDNRLLMSLLPAPPRPTLLVNEDTTLLLRHYQDTVVNLFSPLKYHKTPWQIMFLPNALNSLAQLTLGSLPNQASLCIFNALLSISALHLASVTSNTANLHWLGRAEEYTSRAQLNLKLALQDEDARPKRAKYKELLMSLLSMITVSVFSGTWKHTRCYLLDAERLIRRRGLPKLNKSRKVRLLHHCYAYARIIHESTFIVGTPDEATKSLTSDFSTSEDRSPLRVLRWDGRLDQRLLVDKNTRLGENDLHLAVPGRWDPTMYPDIYGIPESFLVLLSETTRLANERDVLQQNPAESSLTWPQYLFRAKVLEKCICGWEPSREGGGYPQGWNSSVSVVLLENNQLTVNYMLLAMHQSLIIYFYRRIHDLDATILQDRVQQVIDDLMRCADGPESTVCAGVIAWTGFVAACEALDAKLQEQFSTWFQGCIRRSGIKTFEAAYSLAREVWSKRNQGDSKGVSWLDLNKKDKQQLFFT